MAFEFGGASFEAAGEAALYWPEQKALLVADLHLEKASSLAMSSGQMLPPYDSNATLARLEAAAAQFDVDRIFCLGDNFHDDGGEDRLCGEAAMLLSRLTARYDWHWITGNHDPEIKARWGGGVFDEMLVDGIMLRHNIVPGDSCPEISGHFHPKIRLRLRGRMVSRACFLRTGNRLVMPAFGALTGGMDLEEIMRVTGLAGQAEAIIPLASRISIFAVGDAVSPV
ncbi:MAG: ligase-associated DNA damage response endonuclease PdeM [Sphingorhabdus sp.]